MFDRIAPRYDRMNRLISMGLDQRWRRVALQTLAVGPGDRLIDLACGTGDLAELAVARGARVIGTDFAFQMLRGARRRGIGARFVQGDALALPFREGSATCLTCGFALRNFTELPSVFAEMARVLEGGGRLAILEVDRPENAAFRAGHSLYFDQVVPKLGAWLSDRDAYRYLPESTEYLPEAAQLKAQIESAGFEQVKKRSFLFGASQLITARRTSWT